MDNATNVINATSSGTIHLLSHSLILAFWLLTVFNIAPREFLLSDYSISHRKHPKSQGARSIKRHWKLLCEVLSDGMDVAVGDDVAPQEF
jgi:hypothetical protein